jgi:hypothetical protein
LEQRGNIELARNHTADSLNRIEFIVKCNDTTVCFTEFVVDLFQLDPLGVQLVEGC